VIDSVACQLGVQWSRTFCNELTPRVCPAREEVPRASCERRTINRRGSKELLSNCFCAAAGLLRLCRQSDRVGECSLRREWSAVRHLFSLVKKLKHLH